MKIFSLKAHGTAVEPIQADAIAALRELGHEVQFDDVFEYSMEGGPKDIGAELNRCKPDFVFGLANVSIPAGYYNQLKLPYVSWLVDNPFRIISDHFKSDYYLACTWDRSYIAEMRDFGITHTAYLPLAANTAIFKPIEDDEALAPYRCALSFAGGYGQLELIHATGFENSPDLRSAMEQLVAWQVKNPSLDMVAILKHPGFKHPAAPILRKAFAYDPELKRGVEIQVQFGSGLTYRRTMVGSLGDLGITVYGDERWKNIVKDTGINYRGWCDNRTGLPLLFNASEINLNVTITQLRQALPMRVYDILACRGFMLSDERADTGKLFDIGNDLIVYRNIDDLHKKAEYFMRPETAAERREIAAHGYQTVLAKHTYIHRMREMVEVVRSTFGL